MIRYPYGEIFSRSAVLYMYAFNLEEPAYMQKKSNKQQTWLYAKTPKGGKDQMKQKLIWY